MQEKESVMVVRCALKILSLGITVRHHEAPNSFPRDGIINSHLTAIKDSYSTILKHKDTKHNKVTSAKNTDQMQNKTILKVYILIQCI